MKYYFLLIAFFLLIVSHGICQENNEQTKAHLLSELKNAKDDSTRVMDMLNLGYAVYAGSKPDSAVYYYNSAYAIATRINYTKGILRYYACYGDILSSRGDHDKAIQMALSAVALAESSKNEHFTGAAYNNIAGTYTDMGDVDKALEYYLKAINAYEKLDDKKHLAAVYANLLGIYSSVGHSTDQALHYGLKAIEYSRATGNKGVLQEALINVSYVLMRMNKTDRALTMLKEAKTISTSLNDKISLIEELVAVNNMLMQQGKFLGLKANADQISALSKETGDASGKANAPYFMAVYYFELKDYDHAFSYANEALRIANAGKMNELKKDIYDILADIALVKGNIQLYHYNNALGDSLRTKLHTDQVLHNSQELETKYNLAKKQAQIDKLNQEKQIHLLVLQRRSFYIGALFLTIVALLIVGWLVQKNSLKKQKLLTSEKELKEQQIQTLEKEKELLSTQALMQGQEAERSRLAKDLHDGLGGILTGTKYSLSNMKQNMIITAENAAAFEKTMDMLDLSITELRRVAHNMMPESLLKLSLNDALDDYCQQVNNSGALPVTYQSFDIDQLEADDTVKITVFRVVQELINNVVKHASASSAIVQITFKEGILGIAVEDDGKSFDAGNLVYGEGMGYKNIKSRIDFLKGNIDIQSQPGKGTSVLIRIPV